MSKVYNLNTTDAGFAGSTISGVDMQISFGFPAEYFSGDSDGFDIEVVNDGTYVWFKVGTITQIRYVSQRAADPKYILKYMNPLAFGKGIRITQGDIVWKNFDRDSVQQILDKVKGYNQGIDLATINNSPLISVADKDVASKSTQGSTKSAFVKGELDFWDQLPFFDIMCYSKTSDVGKGKVSSFRIKDVKITDTGFSESMDSTEMNDITQFIAISGTEAWAVKQ